MVYSLSILSAIFNLERSTPCRNFIKNLSPSARNLLSKICAELFGFIKQIINLTEFIHRHRQKPTDFSRNRKLPAHTLIVFFLSVLRGSYQNELDRFFYTLNRSDTIERVVSKAAFTKARMKLKYQAFIELNHKLTQFFEKRFKLKTWSNFRLLALDGSTIRLPHTKDIQNHFGVWKVRQGRPSPMGAILGFVLGMFGLMVTT